MKISINSLNVQYNLPRKLSDSGLFLVRSVLIANSISLVVIALLRFSHSS